jgi:KaiC/GvpD/RAD55 family RecA-like ATPase
VTDILKQQVSGKGIVATKQQIMTNLKININWLDELLPEGILIPSSTLISGPGGTGKPLVEFAFVAAWLKAGGSLIGISLQYPGCELLITTMKKLYNLDINDYHKKIVYVQFDINTEGCEKTSSNTLKANLLKPEVWDETINMAENMFEKTGPGTMVFGSALNLLLFSKTYKDSMLNKLKDALQHDKSRTYTFAVSTSAFADEIKILEDAADNLMFTRMEAPMKLFLKITRIKDVKFSGKETEVPIPEEMLKEINEIAQVTRKTRLTEIRNI